MTAISKTTSVSEGLRRVTRRVGHTVHQVTNLFAIAVGGMVLLATPTSGFAVDVSDAGHFFSAQALEKANELIREIEKKSGHEIRIETHATVPADKIDAVAKMDRAQRQEFMNNWTLDRARTVKENGTLILICKEPAYAKTWFSGKLKSAGLTQSDCNQVSETLLAGLKSKNNDAALKDTISRLGDSYAQLSSIPSNLREARPATARRPIGAARQADAPRQAPFSWSPVISIIAMVLFGIFVISLISRLFSGGGGGYGGYGGQPGYGGGGGFMSSLAGGLFGAVAGNWLYDSFSGHSAHARDTLPGAEPWSGDGGPGNDPSGSSDWTDEGSSSGGGWFDNGDSGGGDFGGGGGFDGGGDFGGGGDF